LRQRLGRIDEVMAGYDRAITVLPGDAVLQAHRAIVLHQLGRLDEALSGYDRAVALNPGYAEAHSNRGVTLKDLGRAEEARASFDRAIALSPNYAIAHYNRGVLLHELKQFDEAIASYDRALALNPDHAESHANRGVTLTEQGNIAAATESYERALALKPDYAECFRNFASIRKFTDGDPLVARMRALADAGGLADVDLMHLHFGLGKAEHDLGNRENAFRHFADGNARRKAELGYDIAREVELFAALKAYFPAGDSSPPARQEGGATPVFILGMPRSGTTLVEQIVSSHSRVFGAGELALLNEAVVASRWQQQDQRREEAIATVASFYRGKLAELSGAPIVTDKMPLNFRWIGFIREALPEARIVHLKRDAAAVCWSNFRTYFPASGMGFTFALADVATYYRLYEELMAFWHARYPGAIYNLDYEALTEDQEGETRRLLDYLGLGWEDAVLAFHKNERSVGTASKLQVRQQMYRGSSQEWKKYEPWLQPMLEILRA